MKFLATLALLAATATAGPVTKTFSLQTTGASNSSLNGLYLTTKSTGPLNSLAVFTGGASDAASFYLLNGTVRYQAENGAPWAIALVSEDDRKAPVEVSVSPTTGSTGFSFASDGDLETSNKNWGGWLACTDSALYYVNLAETGSYTGCDTVELKASS
ncbi:hypothetical protein N7451_001318 [Penicillium sp. IBT 35674x]|nr:hypothetical protein N7451_001318 [Penicillium sp. IBT 35674x]